MHWDIERSVLFDGIEVFIYGDFNAKDFAVMVDEILDEPQWTPGSATLFDYSHCTFHQTSFQELVSAGDLHISKDPTIGNGPSALVMPELDHYGMGRTHQNRIGHRVQSRIGVFRSREEALDWLTGMTSTSRN